jgi:hypothetical protein
MTKKTQILRLAVIALVLGAVAVFLSFAHEGEGPSLDGKIGADEYQNHYFDEDINMDVYWTISDDDIYVALKAPAGGWVSIGLRPGIPAEEEEEAMKDVDFMIGYVKDGQTFARDDFGDTPFSHKADTDLGGTDNIEAFAGSEEGGVTIIEFERLLNTKDEYDADVPARGEVYLAYSNADDFTSIHTQRTEVVLNFVTGAAEKEEEEE